MNHLLTRVQVFTWIGSTALPLDEERCGVVDWWQLATKLSLRPHFDLIGHILGCYADGIVHLEASQVHNTAILKNAQPILAHLLGMARPEARQWVTAGTRGLAALLLELSMSSDQGCGCRIVFCAYCSFQSCTNSSFYQCNGTQCFCVFSQKNETKEM